MYGQIHVCVRSLVLEKFGEDAWKKILEKCELDDTTDFMVFHRYDDTSTFALISALSEVLDVPMPAVLEIFGEFFFQYCLKNGYDRMLRTLGSDFKSFIQNLDSLHALLEMSYKDIVAPSFRCESSDSEDVLFLHYYTIRPGLYPIVLGMVKAVGKELFQSSTDMEVLSITQQIIDGGTLQEHVVFKVLLDENATNDRKQIDRKSGHATMPLQMSVDCFCSVCPYHVIFDDSLHIVHSGSMIQQLCPAVQRPSSHMGDCFKLLRPKMTLTLENINMFINSNFMLEVKLEHQNGLTIVTHSKIVLKGQMIYLEDSKMTIFMCSPRVSSLTELVDMNVFMSDIPIYDVTRELILLNQQRIAEIEISKKLDETTAALKKTSAELEKEKKKTDTLLYQMLPEKVAKQLRDGMSVEAEKFAEVTILFSDIVTFTNISAACTPMDIVGMLNSLYQRFDNQTNVHGVYKVETIGDAYMVVGGAPELASDHAQKVCKFAIDMITEATEVPSPATGKPLQIRVGIHTGPVVAGVVGQKMPRYCLFGDTVNTASRMESHGIPGNIHISETTERAIKGCDFLLESRGEIEVKGKGMMHTHFLLGLGDPSSPVKNKITIRDVVNALSESSAAKKVLAKTNSVENTLAESNLVENTLVESNSVENALAESSAGEKALAASNSVENVLTDSNSAEKALSESNAAKVNEIILKEPSANAATSQPNSDTPNDNGPLKQRKQRSQLCAVL